MERRGGQRVVNAVVPKPRTKNPAQPTPPTTQVPGECGDGMKMLVKVFCPEGAVTTSKLKLGSGISRNPNPAVLEPRPNAKGSSSAAGAARAGGAGAAAAALGALAAAALAI
jgi:hypothetical protein